MVRVGSHALRGTESNSIIGSQEKGRTGDRASGDRENSEAQAWKNIIIQENRRSCVCGGVRLGLGISYCSLSLAVSSPTHQTPLEEKENLCCSLQKSHPWNPGQSRQA